jgi:excisionase family DNA binding protein
MDTQDSMLTSEDVAKYLKVDVVTVRRFVSRGELAAYRVGAEFRFTLSDLQDYLKRQYMPVGPLPRSGQREAAPAGDMSFHIISNQILSRFFGAKKPRPGSTAIGERFTERARNALALSQAAADQQRCAHIYTSHLLLGLAEETGGIASRALGDLGVSAERIKSVLARHPNLTGPTRETGDSLGLDPDVKRALQAAVAHANKLSHDTVGTEHMLLGLLKNEQNKATGVLRELEVQQKAVRAKVHELIKNAGS